MKRIEDVLVRIVQVVAVLMFSLVIAAPIMTIPHTFQLLKCDQQLTGPQNVAWGAALYIIVWIATRKYCKIHPALTWLPSLILVPVFGFFSFVDHVTLFAWTIEWGVPESGPVTQFVLTTAILVLVDLVRWLIRYALMSSASAQSCTSAACPEVV